IEDGNERNIEVTCVLLDDLMSKLKNIKDMCILVNEQFIKLDNDKHNVMGFY
ncbi:MAG: hypothetical protein HYX60_07245, partial [Legionella longbeachae]|nr:hypothetical protein [Legionella longbeachae]